MLPLLAELVLMWPRFVIELIKRIYGSYCSWGVVESSAAAAALLIWSLMLESTPAISFTCKNHVFTTSKKCLKLSCKFKTENQTTWFLSLKLVAFFSKDRQRFRLKGFGFQLLKIEAITLQQCKVFCKRKYDCGYQSLLAAEWMMELITES